MAELEIRPFRPGDEAAVLETFNLVFREVCGPGYVDRTPAEWEWEFAANPRGHRIVLAVAPDGRVAAQYAAVPMAALAPGGPASFVHAVDSMVHPAFRQGLKKPGLFVEVGRAWFEHIRGLGLDAVGFGYPVRPAWRIGSACLGYTLIRVIDYLVAEPADRLDRPAGAARVEVEPAAVLPAGEVDRLWEEWARGERCAVVRDEAYLGWRYLRCPHVAYRLLLARREGRLAGLAVLRPVHELVPGAATLADWLVLPGEEAAGRALLAEAGRLAREAGRRRLLAVLPPWHAAAGLLRREGFREVPSQEFLERRLGSYCWRGELTSELLAAVWYYTLGDSDLV